MSDDMYLVKKIKQYVDIFVAIDTFSQNKNVLLINTTKTITFLKY